MDLLIILMRRGFKQQRRTSKTMEEQFFHEFDEYFNDEDNFFSLAWVTPCQNGRITKGKEREDVLLQSELDGI